MSDIQDDITATRISRLEAEKHALLDKVVELGKENRALAAENTRLAARLAERPGATICAPDLHKEYDSLGYIFCPACGKVIQ